MAGVQLTCRACGVQFVHDRRKAYCSPNCYPNRYPKPGAWAWAESRQTFRCFCCGKAFQPKRKGRTAYCSRECCFTVKAAFGANKEYDEAPRREAWLAERQWQRSPEGQHAKREKAREYAKQRYIVIADASCVQCGKEFRRGTGNPTRFSCSAVCLDERRQKEKRIHSARKRMRRDRQKAGDPIDPIAVFERDGWRCKICGRKTPQSRRGTYHPSAPEMDHIVAIANGGTHTWDNVQCACRKCNAAKGASNFGQLLLFPKGLDGGPKMSGAFT